LDEVTGGDVVVAALAGAGVEVVFGIPSVHNLPIYDALRRHGGIRSVVVRHEQAAAGAADAYSRVSGRLGVCITSTGPGAANAMGGLLEAFVSSSPVLHLTGQIDSRFVDQRRGFIHEVPDQPAMLGSLSKVVRRAAGEDDIAQRIAECIRIALTPPRGPVSLEVPIDYQYASADPAALEVAGSADRYQPPAPLAPQPQAVARAAGTLASSRRPLIWAGGGVAAAGAAPELARLAQLLGAGVLTSPNGRGVLPEDDPLCIGNVPWDADVRELCKRADVLLAVGTRFQGPNTQNWQMELPPVIVQVDVEPAAIGRSYPVQVALVSDASLALRGLLEQLEGADLAPDAGWRDEITTAATLARATLRATLGPQVGLLDALQPLVGPGTVVVKDSTIPAYTWGNRLLRVSRPGTSVMPNGFAIGLGLPHAIGAAVAAGGEPVLLLVGDGGFMLAPGELATIAEERLGVVVLLFDDGGYGILRNIQDSQFGARIGVELGAPDFCGLARSLGVAAERVDSVDSYARVVAASIESARQGLATLVEVDIKAIGPMATPFIGTSRPPAPR
jgi:acetolactate synthase-1/2/3 large subunit